MSEVSISDVKVTFCDVKFTLRANNEALALIEQELSAPYGVVFNRMSRGVPRLTDVTASFGAFALPHGAYDGATIRKLMDSKGLDGGQRLAEAYEHVSKAITAAQPKPEKTAEVADKGAADPP